MRLARIVLAALGISAVGFGLWGAVLTPGAQPLRHFTFMASLVLAHDLVLLPCMLAVGALVVRYVPTPVRATVQGALIISAAVSLTALPFVLGFGKLADNPSALPANYTTGLLIVLAAVWATAAVVAGLRHRRKDRTS